METEPHYFRVGVYIIALVTGLALFSLWLVSDGLQHARDYRIYFAESVSGLNLGSPVKYRGVSVGQVKEIIIDKKDSRLIRVTVEIENDTPVKVGTKVRNIRLVDGDHDIDCKIDGFGQMGPPIG